MSVAFAHGAAARAAGTHEDELRAHFGLAPEELLLITWADGVHPPAGFPDWLASRFDHLPEPHLEAHEALAAATLGDPVGGDAVAVAGDSAPADLIDPRRLLTELGGALLERGAAAAPVWLRREILRAVWGGIAAGGASAWDAIHYLANGHRLIDRAEQLLGAWTAPRPRVAIGISLGGVVLVDALARFVRRGEPAPVDLLVTVGSQAALVHLSEALEMDRQGPTAGPFTPWLNVWNPDDFLSFPAAAAFGSLPGLTDARIETPALVFPETHSAYFRPDQPAWAPIDAAIEALPPVSP